MKLQSEPEVESPFQIPLFRSLWTANFFSNTGFWLQATGAAWLMTELSHSVIWVSGVQAASTAPVFLFSIFGGIIGDHRRKSTFLKHLQVARALIATALALSIVFHAITPGLLIFYVFLLGTITALNMPAWQSAVGMIVPIPLLVTSASLNNLSFNLGRALGGALSGVLFGHFGAAFVFGIAAASTFGLISQYRTWEKTEAPPANPIIGNWSTVLLNAIKIGKDHAEFRSLILRSSFLFFFGTSTWALLPIYAKQTLGLDSMGFGMLNGVVAVGSVLAALSIHRFFKKKSETWLLCFSSLLLSLGALTLGATHVLATALPGLLVIGMGWSLLVSHFNASVQKLFEKNLRARASALFMLCFYAAMSLGNLTWGWLTEHTSLTCTFLVCGGAFLVYALRMVRVSVSKREGASNPLPAI